MRYDGWILPIRMRAPTTQMSDLPAHDGAASAPATRSILGQLRGMLRSWLRARNGDETVRETIEELIEEREDAGVSIDSDERVLLSNILKLHDVTAEDVMVPRAEIVAADMTTSLDDLMTLVATEAHSRIPLYREKLDDVVGFVHMKDLVAAIGKEAKVDELMRELLFAAPSIRVLDLLLEMRASRTHMAIVVDELGGVDGLVTIEDLVEEIVGEIEDEHDEEGPQLLEQPGGYYIADARVRVEEFEEQAGEFASEEEREEIDTLGGIVASLVGRVPRRGEVIGHPSGLEFEVEDADPRRIKRLRVRRAAPAKVDDGGATG